MKSSWKHQLILICPVNVVEHKAFWDSITLCSYSTFTFIFTIHTLLKRWPSDKLIMSVIILNLHIKTLVNIVSYVFRVYCYCIDLDHIFHLSFYVGSFGHYNIYCLPYTRAYTGQTNINWYFQLASRVVLYSTHCIISWKILCLETLISDRPWLIILKILLIMHLSSAQK